MKKLMTVIAAVAMSFGLFEADATPFSISFEAGENDKDKGVDTTAMTFDAKNADGWTWAGDPLALKEYNGDKYGYTTADRRDDEFDGKTDNLNYLPLSTGSDELARAMGSGNIFVDQLVKFTGFEDVQTNLVGDTKIAVWMSGIENDTGVTGETNLYVTVGKVDIDQNVEQVALKIDNPNGVAWETEKWYRLTIKSIGDIFEGAGNVARAGFIVYIDGVQVGSSDPTAKDLIAESLEGHPAAALMAKGQLFTAIDVKDTTFNTVAYKGIGAIDDVILDDQGPEFCQTVPVTIDPVTGAVIDQVLDKDGNVVTAGQDGRYEIAPGDFQIVWKNAENYMPFTKPIGHTTNDDMPIDDSTALEEDIEEVVATVNGAPFASLEAALAKVQELEPTGANIQVVIKKDCDPVTVAEGTFNFTKNTRIDITPATSSWFVSGGATLLADIQEEATFEMDYDSTLTYAGTVAGTLIADAITIPVGSAITLDVTGAIIVGEETDITPVDGYKLVKTEISGGEYGGMYSYTVEELPPAIEYVTFTVSYDDTKIENVSVKTNGEAVVIAQGVYTVESNAVVTVAADAKEGYKDVTITGNNVTVDEDGVFKADKAVSVITIDATALIDLSAAEIILSKDEVFEGDEMPTFVKATLNEKDLTEADFTLTEPTAEIVDGAVLTWTITGKGDYTGTASKSITVQKKATPTRPTVIDGGDDNQKEAYDAWAAAQTAAGKTVDPTNPLTVDRFILDAAADATQAALEEKLAAEITDEMLKDLVAGTDFTGEFTLEKYPNAKFKFEETKEIPSVEGVSKFWRLTAFFKSAN